MLYTQVYDEARKREKKERKKYRVRSRGRLLELISLPTRIPTDPSGTWSHAPRSGALPAVLWLVGPPSHCAIKTEVGAGHTARGSPRTPPPHRHPKNPSRSRGRAQPAAGRPATGDTVATTSTPTGSAVHGQRRWRPEGIRSFTRRSTPTRTTTLTRETMAASGSTPPAQTSHEGSHRNLPLSLSLSH